MSRPLAAAHAGGQVGQPGPSDPTILSGRAWRPRRAHFPLRARCQLLIIRRPLANARSGGQVGRPRPSDRTAGPTLPLVRPISGLANKSGPNRVVPDIIRLLRCRFKPTQAMIEKIPLPPHSG